MVPDEAVTERAAKASARIPEHRHEIRPIDPGYQLVVRTVLWVIAGTVLLAFVIWWSLT